MSDPFEIAEQQLARLRDAAQQFDLSCVPLENPGVAVAFAVPIPADGSLGFATVSLSVPTPSQAYVSGGVLLQPAADRAKILEGCNSWNADNPTYATFLHSAGDVMMQMRMPVEVFVRFPPLLDMAIGGIPVVAAKARERLAANGVDGGPYAWPRDAQRLAVHSVL